MTDHLPLGSHLNYRQGVLHLEQANLSELARTHGTPLFVYSKAAMLDALLRLPETRENSARKAIATGRSRPTPIPITKREIASTQAFGAGFSAASADSASNTENSLRGKPHG